MDDKTTQANDMRAALELLRNERTVMHPKFGPVRFKRPTTEQDALIADVRRRKYHTDMFDDADPKRSKDELRERAINKGMWRPEFEQQIDDLSRRMGEAMGVLDAMGFKSLESLISKFNTNVRALLDIYKDSEEIRDAIGVYFNLDNKVDHEARAKILAEAPTTAVDDLLEEGDTLRMQIDLLSEMNTTREELEKLRRKEQRLFVDSMESRADREEELARVYYCSTDAATGKPLWLTLDEMRRADPQDVEFLVLEMAYFVNGVTEEFKEVLGRFGFTRRQIDTSDSSDDSLDLPESNSDGESAVSEPSPSSEPSA